MISNDHDHDHDHDHDDVDDDDGDDDDNDADDDDDDDGDNDNDDNDEEDDNYYDDWNRNDIAMFTYVSSIKQNTNYHSIITFTDALAVSKALAKGRGLLQSLHRPHLLP